MTPAVVGGGGVCVVVVVKNFNLGHNFFVTKAYVLKLHTLVHHHKGYNLTKGHNSVMHFDKIMPLYGLRDLQTSVGLRVRGSGLSHDVARQDYVARNLKV